MAGYFFKEILEIRRCEKKVDKEALEASASSLKRSSSLLAATSTSPAVSMSPLPMSTDSSSATTVNGYEVFPGLPRIPGITRTKMGF